MAILSQSRRVFWNISSRLLTCEELLLGRMMEADPLLCLRYHIM